MMKQKATRRDDDARDLGSERGEPVDLQTSVRISQATQRAIDWIGRVRGYNFGKAYSHAIAVTADTIKWRDLSFKDVYHPGEGVWWCRMFLAGLTSIDSEALRTEFVSAHKPFFFAKVGREWKPDEQKIPALWPSIDFLTDHWFKRRELDAWATGEKMADMLKDARIAPPAWGPKAEIER